MSTFASSRTRVLNGHKTIIITGGDANVAALLKGLIVSLEAFPERAHVDIGCIDLGLAKDDVAWLEARNVRLVRPRSHFGLRPDELKPYEKAVIARPFLRDYFPDYEIYIWIDSDVWLQRWDVIEAFSEGARTSGLAIAHERERAYVFQAWLYGWFAKHLIAGYGLATGVWLLSRPQLNAGIFALRATSPQWERWLELYVKAWKRTGKLTPHDQFSLNQLVHGSVFGKGRAQATVLEPRNNWICDRGAPMWNDAEAALCEPYPPYRPIGALHLAGPGKRTTYRINRTNGLSFDAKLLQGVAPSRD